jgi:hypothetical protein
MSARILAFPVLRVEEQEKPVEDRQRAIEQVKKRTRGSAA